MMDKDSKKAFAALSFIIPKLRERNLRWVITGGFACSVYGVKRELTDIDIDIDVSKDSPLFLEPVYKVLNFKIQSADSFPKQGERHGVRHGVRQRHKR